MFLPLPAALPRVLTGAYARVGIEAVEHELRVSRGVSEFERQLNGIFSEPSGSAR
jgi:hypothetical protein